MNKIFKNKPLGLAILVFTFFLSVAFLFGASYAIDKVLPFHRETVSNITTGNFNVKLDERYQEPSGVLPGQSVEKVVNVKNTGSVDALVRVKVRKVCNKPNGESLSNANDIIKIDYDETDWLYINGYYYYKNILKANSETKTPLFKNYTISKAAGNEYKNAHCDIIVNADTIQAAEDAVNSLWNIENPETFLKSSYGLYQGAYELDSKVTYSKEKTFAFDGEETENIDLFKNFKNLAPGTTRRQLITVENNYQNAQAFYLKAKETNQGDSLDDQTRQKINSLIKTYATINITNEAGDSIYNGPIWGNLDSDNPTMKDYILLGSIESNKSEDYTISLSVSENMPNDYQDLIGYITWEFGTLNTDAIINVHHYIEGTTIPINVDGEDVPTEVVPGEIGKTYTANYIDTNDKYTLVSEKTQTATFKAEDTEIIFYYRLSDPVFNQEPKLTKTSNPEVINTKDDSVTYNIKYETTFTEFKGIITVNLEDELPEGKKLDESYTNNFDEGTYNDETNKITWSPFKYNIDTYDNDPNNDSITITKQITVKYKNVENNEELINTINSTTKYKLTETGEDLGEIKSTATAKTDVELQGKVIVKHLIYGTENPVDDRGDDILEGKIGDDYETQSREKDLEGYVLVGMPENANGVWTEDPIIVKYYYKLDNSESKSGIEKFGFAEAKNSTTEYLYTIKYKGKIKNYIGDAKLTITDQLPYPISIEDSSLNGGTYDRTKNTITWEMPIENIDSTKEDYDLNYTIEFKVTFLSIPNVKNIINKASFLLETDKEEKGNTSVTTKLYSVPSKVIVNHIDKKTKKKIIKSEVINGHSGKSYKTKVSKKVLNKGYKLYGISGYDYGIMNSDTIEVTYIYERVNNGISNPYTGDDITIYIIMSITALIIIISTIIYLGLSKRRAQ